MSSRGVVTLIGATTENPSFAVNAALLSRCKVFRTEPLTQDDVAVSLKRALADETLGLGKEHLAIDDDALEALASAARGDARRALSTLEMTAEHVRAAGRQQITVADLKAANDDATLLYDKKGEEHYNVISAFIKSMRGSDPDAAIYYMMRMVEAGDDPLFILRRMLIFASEDIGNADPRALMVAVAGDEAFRRVGLPEGLYPMSQVCIYLACAPKSDGVKKAWTRARQVIEDLGALPVPKKLRNAVTPAHEGGRLWAGLSICARLRRACGPRRDVFARSHQRRFVLRAERRRAREGHQRAARAATQAYDLKLGCGTEAA